MINRLGEICEVIRDIQLEEQLFPSPAAPKSMSSMQLLISFAFHRENGGRGKPMAPVLTVPIQVQDDDLADPDITRQGGVRLIWALDRLVGGEWGNVANAIPLSKF